VRRPDLLALVPPTPEEQEWLDELEREGRAS
jgi:hypothetical protein